MMKLQPDATVLTGCWIVQGGKANGDVTRERIGWLLARHLRKVADNPEGGRWTPKDKDFGLQCRPGPE
jgi:hypothetical protein